MTIRHKPLRSHRRRRYPLAKTMARMGILREWGEVHPTKGYWPITKYDRFIRNVE